MIIIVRTTLILVFYTSSKSYVLSERIQLQHANMMETLAGKQMGPFEALLLKEKCIFQNLSTTRTHQYVKDVCRYIKVTTKTETNKGIQFQTKINCTSN